MSMPMFTAEASLLGRGLTNVVDALSAARDGHGIVTVPTVICWCSQWSEPCRPGDDMCAGLPYCRQIQCTLGPPIVIAY